MGDGLYIYGRVDLTPAQPGSLTATVQVRLLVESELGSKERKLLDYGVHTQALSLLKERERVRGVRRRVSFSFVGTLVVSMDAPLTELHDGGDHVAPR